MYTNLSRAKFTFVICQLHLLAIAIVPARSEHESNHRDEPRTEPILLHELITRKFVRGSCLVLPSSPESPLQDSSSS